MKVGFVGRVDEKDMRRFFDLVSESTTETETEEEKEKRFESILIDWINEGKE